MFGKIVPEKIGKKKVEQKIIIKYFRKHLC